VQATEIQLVQVFPSVLLECKECSINAWLFLQRIWGTCSISKCLSALIEQRKFCSALNHPTSKHEILRSGHSRIKTHSSGATTLLFLFRCFLVASSNSSGDKSMQNKSANLSDTSLGAAWTPWFTRQLWLRLEKTFNQVTAIPHSGVTTMSAWGKKTPAPPPVRQRTTVAVAGLAS
jgi:hypothetical protein